VRNNDPFISSIVYRRNDVYQLFWFSEERVMENNVKLQIDEDSTRRFLTQQQWPQSLQDVLVKGCSTFVLRYFIIDDSGRR
jgi:hypothetical protein